MKEFLAPQINSKDSTVEIVDWYVEDGAEIKAGDDLVDLGTSKAVVTVSAEQSGFFRRIRAKGAFVPVGQALGMICATQKECESLKHSEEAVVPTEKFDSAPRARKASKAKLAEIDALTQGVSGGINSAVTVQFHSEGLRSRLAREKLFNGQVLPVILYELSKVIKANPEMGAFFHKDWVYYYDRINIGVAIDLGAGLKVVTIPDAEKLSANEFYGKLVDFGMRIARNSLTLEDLQGSTFTVTDLSGSDIFSIHPLINGRQSAILGIGGDSTLPGKPMTLTLTYDHRIMSGRQVSEILRSLKARLLSYAESTNAI